MVSPLPAQPDAAASPNRTRPRPKRGAPKKVQHTAQDWASSVIIPTHYPDPDGRKVKYRDRAKAVLYQLACWCNDNVGFEPAPILEDFTSRKGESKSGILTSLGFDHGVYRKCLSTLGKLGFISTKRRGNQYHRTQYTLHVDILRTEYQEALPLDTEIRTDDEQPDTDDVKEHMPSEHMPSEHMPSEHMPSEHMPSEHMPSEHMPQPHPLYKHVHEDDLSVEGSAPMSMSAVADGGGASSFCSDFLIPSLEDAGLHGFTEASLAFIDLAATDFTRTYGRPPDRAVADHVARRLVGFIRDKGIDVESEAHRVFGYLRSKQIVPLVPVEETVTLSFGAPKPSSEHPEAPAPPPPEVTLDPEAQAIWARALDRLREKVARAAYETWLVDTVGVACEGGVFIVGVSNRFVSEMLVLQVHSQIEATVQECAGDESLTVQFAVIAMPDRREAQ